MLAGGATGRTSPRLAQTNESKGVEANEEAVDEVAGGWTHSHSRDGLVGDDKTNGQVPSAGCLLGPTDKDVPNTGVRAGRPVHAPLGQLMAPSSAGSTVGRGRYPKDWLAYIQSGILRDKMPNKGIVILGPDRYRARWATMQAVGQVRPSQVAV
ncbi:hypothetical protein B0T26DRAFT_675487 [Lasiosphaeria miniovina]|uniref:Uncharacterized protein n=1 Tax=Lasiosphaeria miniovina TaxID=1954250 RepID=A0AA40AJQ0_9PEZI|nr:uncharacterized protein B0T26DRAFT_675487 [Lasiosphaeria miniovina]KAK0717128.1 hypothetical protein B0T26DRAFT_675487 [Lasiosphaeria miniovina]